MSDSGFWLLISGYLALIFMVIATAPRWLAWANPIRWDNNPWEGMIPLPARYRRRLAGRKIALALAVGLFGRGAVADPLRIAALGDSNTAGYLVPAERSYPAQLERLLRGRGHDVLIENLGRHGLTSSHLLQGLSPLTHDVAIVFIGRNDKRRRVPRANTLAHVEKAVRALRARGIQVVLAGFEDYSYGAIAGRHGAVYVPDFFAGLVDKDGVRREEFLIRLDTTRLFGALHLNERGYAVVANTLAPAVETAISRLPDKPALANRPPN